VVYGDRLRRDKNLGRSLQSAFMTAPDPAARTSHAENLPTNSAPPTAPTRTPPPAPEPTPAAELDSARVCPRCGAPVPPRRSSRGRPALWCSPTCRKAASADRRAAHRVDAPVRIVEVERVREIVRRIEVPVRAPVTPEQAVAVVLDSPAACRKVLQQLTKMVRTGRLDTDRGHGPTKEAAWALALALNHAAHTHQR
jgi:hypothetical protein